MSQSYGNIISLPCKICHYVFDPRSMHKWGGGWVGGGTGFMDDFGSFYVCVVVQEDLTATTRGGLRRRLRVGITWP
jgi:hypothetical protein